MCPRIAYDCSQMENELLPSMLLGAVLFGRTRRRLLALLFGAPDEWFHTRDIHRRAGISLGALTRELSQLTDAGILRRQTRGNQVLHAVNPDSPIFAEMRSIVTKTIGLGDVIREALRPLAERIRVAFIYGSFARGQQRGRSDVDLMVIGDLSLAEVSSAISGAERTLAREVNPTLFHPSEYRRKLAEEHHFVASVHEGAKVFIIGSEDDLRQLQHPRPGRAHPTAGAVVR